MAALTNAPTERFNFGPLVARHYRAVAINNGDTLVVPFIRVLAVNIEPTTAAAAGYTKTQAASGATLTFVTGGAITADLFVIGREG